MGYRIQIIEDNQETRENTAELLELSGYEVQCASNGIEGLNQLKQNPVDLILCNVSMPVLDGYGVLMAIKNQPGLLAIPFVFVTAKAERADFRRAMDLGADDYIVKPVTGEELLRLIDARLQRYKAYLKHIVATKDDLAELMKNANDVLSAAMFSHGREIKHYKRKDSIFMEGDSAKHLYYVISGKVKTYRANADGKEYITGVHPSDNFFGHLAIINDNQRKESAVALEDSEIALLPKKEFQLLLASNLSFSLQFMAHVMQSLDEAEARMLNLAYDSARKKVAEALLFLFRKYGRKDGETIPLSRENLSTLAGISMESTSRHLSELRDEKLIETFHGVVRIWNAHKLEQLRY